jgi:hypothetical protein
MTLQRPFVHPAEGRFSWKASMVKSGRSRVVRWAALIFSIILASQLGPARAQTHNRAGLVIRYADGRVSAYCVRFDEPSITGFEALTRASVKAVVEPGGLGVAMCALNGQGCAYPAQPCFCQCQGANCAYWNYFHLIDGAWKYSQLGASASTLADGSVDGWSWGDKVAPPAYTIDQICAAAPATAPAIATQPATLTPAIQPTATTEPTRQQVVESTTQLPPPITASKVAAQPSIQPTPEPTIPPAGEPIVQPSNHPTTGRSNYPTNLPSEPTPVSPTDAGSYVFFGIVLATLGGWLLVSQARRRR